MLGPPTIGQRTFRPTFYRPLFSAWKWIARLNKIGCGGSIIHENFVVTAGHCCDAVKNRDDANEMLVFTINEFDRNTFSGHEIEITPINFILHPDYSPETIENDICLLQTAEKIDFENEDLAPACLPKGPVKDGNKCFVAGWGKTSETGQQADLLQEIKVEIISHSKCNGANVYNGEVDENSMFCAGDLKGGIDSCQGDSGGPLICVNDDDEPVLDGIVSWGFGCARENSPGVYTRINSYTTWIEDTIRELIAPETTTQPASTTAATTKATTVATTQATTAATEATTTAEPLLLKFPGGTCSAKRIKIPISFQSHKNTGKWSFMSHN